MSGDDTPTTPDPAPDAKLDPAGLQDALGRTGRMLKSAGLPFDDDEFDDEADDDSLSESSDGDSISASIGSEEE